MTGGPKMQKSPLARIQGPSINTDAAKTRGWMNHGILVVDEGDRRLTSVEKDLVRQLGEKLYGCRRHREVCHG